MCTSLVLKDRKLRDIRTTIQNKVRIQSFARRASRHPFCLIKVALEGRCVLEKHSNKQIEFISLIMNIFEDNSDSQTVSPGFNNRTSRLICNNWDSQI